VSGPFLTNEDSAQLNAITSSGTWGVIEYDAGEVGLLDDLRLKTPGEEAGLAPAPSPPEER